MITGKGKSVCKGLAIGPVRVFQETEGEVSSSLGAEAELSLYRSAVEKARADLEALYARTLEEIGEDEAAIIEIQSLLLDDPDYVEGVEAAIQDGKSAHEAVKETGEGQAEAFEALDDDYMRARAADIRDITKRLCGLISGKGTSFVLDEPSVIVAEDLTPSETVQLDKSKVLAFVTRKGSSNSHTAILSRVMNIPSLVQCGIQVDPSLEGRLIIVDGDEGVYFLDPDEETLEEKKREAEEKEAEKSALESCRGKRAAVKFFANIGDDGDLEAVLQGDAEGIGLMRSEFLYLGRDDYPAEEELFEKYRKVVSGMDGKLVVIRTLDIGADKQASYFGLPHEENPALGLRGIRVCLKDGKLFRTQLRAIYRASAYGKVAIMFPMIISGKEVIQVKAFCESVKGELEEEGIAYDKDVQLGIMIETPAAAVMSDELAPLVDFFSVGTNDLTQYTLAIDRQNESLDEFLDVRHPAVLRLLGIIAENARKAGIWAGICGELAADETLTKVFMDMGYTELSVAPGKILALRKRLLEV